MLGGVESRTIPGPPLRLSCFACDCDDAPATSYQYGERAKFLFAPVSPFTETNYVKCGNCGELYVSSTSVFKLSHLGPKELSTLLYRRIPLIPLSMAILGVLLCAVPVIGFGVNLIAMVMNWKRRKHWTGFVSTIGAALSILPTVAFLIWMFIAPSL
jgi:hypothetical protein